MCTALKHDQKTYQSDCMQVIFLVYSKVSCCETSSNKNFRIHGTESDVCVSKQYGIFQVTEGNDHDSKINSGYRSYL